MAHLMPRYKPLCQCLRPGNRPPEVIDDAHDLDAGGSVIGRKTFADGVLSGPERLGGLLGNDNDTARFGIVGGIKAAASNQFHSRRRKIIWRYRMEHRGSRWSGWVAAGLGCAQYPSESALKWD